MVIKRHREITTAQLAVPYFLLYDKSLAKRAIHPYWLSLGLLSVLKHTGCTRTSLPALSHTRPMAQGLYYDRKAIRVAREGRGRREPERKMPPLSLLAEALTALLPLAITGGEREGEGAARRA